MTGRSVGDRDREADVRCGREEDPEVLSQGTAVDDLDQHLRVGGTEKPEQAPLRHPQAGEGYGMPGPGEAAALHGAVGNLDLETAVAGTVIDAQGRAVGAARWNGHPRDPVTRCFREPQVAIRAGRDAGRIRSGGDATSEPGDDSERGDPPHGLA